MPGIAALITAAFGQGRKKLRNKLKDRQCSKLAMRNPAFLATPRYCG